jgi:hypothetical protein
MAMPVIGEEATRGHGAVLLVKLILVRVQIRVYPMLIEICMLSRDYGKALA